MSVDTEYLLISIDTKLHYLRGRDQVRENQAALNVPLDWLDVESIERFQGRFLVTGDRTRKLGQQELKFA